MDLVLPENEKIVISKQGKEVKLGKNQPILIEGIHALNEEVTASIPKHKKFKIFIYNFIDSV